MELNYDKLIELTREEEILDWFAQHFGKQTYTLGEIFEKDLYIPHSFLLFVERFFYETLSEEERSLLYKKLDVINSENVRRSFSIRNSNYIFDSYNIIDSSELKQCGNIINSKVLLRCSSLKNSSHCVDSCLSKEIHYAYACNLCTNSKQLNQCFDLTQSEYDFLCEASSDLILCSGCIESNRLFGCFSLKRCNNCMFCVGLEDKEYYIFNEPVEPEKYDLICNTILKIWNESEIKQYIKIPDHYITVFNPPKHPIKLFDFLPKRIIEYIKKSRYYKTSLIFLLEEYTND